MRKSSIQLQSVVLKPRLFSVLINFMGEMVLSAELRSTKRSRYGILCGSVVPESILVRVQAGRDVVYDVLEN